MTKKRSLSHVIFTGLRINRGFTMIEILVVVTIIGLLAGVGAVSYSQFVKKARDARRQADLENVRSALEQYRSDVETYPITDYDGLSTELTSPIKYIETIPLDPKPTTQVYYYTSSSGDDYKLGAFLESSSASACGGGISCGSVGNCNYCLGPYGQIN